LKKSEVVNDTGSVYKVFTPFKKKWLLKLGSDQSAYLKDYIIPWTESFHSPNPKPVWQSPLREVHALQDMGFVASSIRPPTVYYNENVLKHYAATRDFPAHEGGTTHMGLALRFGTVSVRSCVRNALRVGAETWLSELIWREFFMQILYHFPQTVNQPFRPEFQSLNYRYQEEEWQRWCQGMTGEPLVDAGMRELNATGYMHNRVRMVVASYLTKSLLHSWTLGERYFAAKLFDFDLSANVGNWQWAAGCGVDAAPYFRIFNPQAQAERFDPRGEYIKKWVPELGSASYPKPLVDLAFARKRALDFFAKYLPKNKKE